MRTMNLHLAFMVLAAFCFALAALDVTVPRVNLMALGLCFAAISALL
jgi:hypothetical protein